MVKGLYDIFKCWFNDGKGYVWFYSDPHFSDVECYKLRFPDRFNKDKDDSELVKEFDDMQISNINSKVGRFGTIVILGDVGNIECVKKLKGRKVLILGNHDAGETIYKRNIVTESNVLQDNKLFDEVYTGMLTISDKIILSHEPVNVPFMYNVHGHDHSHNTTDDTHLNVIAEALNYTPISLKEIINSGKLKNIENIHRNTIDFATERKAKRVSKSK